MKPTQITKIVPGIEVAGVQFEHRSGNTYSADNVRLFKCDGEWTVRVTGGALDLMTIKETPEAAVEAARELVRRAAIALGVAS